MHDKVLFSIQFVQMLSTSVQAQNHPIHDVSDGQGKNQPSGQGEPHTNPVILRLPPNDRIIRPNQEAGQDQVKYTIVSETLLKQKKF